MYNDLLGRISSVAETYLQQPDHVSGRRHAARPQLPVPRVRLLRAGRLEGHPQPDAQLRAALGILPGAVRAERPAGNPHSPERLQHRRPGRQPDGAAFHQVVGQQLEQLRSALRLRLGSLRRRQDGHPRRLRHLQRPHRRARPPVRWMAPRPASRRPSRCYPNSTAGSDVRIGTSSAAARAAVQPRR